MIPVYCCVCVHVELLDRCTLPPKLTLNFWCTLPPKLTLNYWCTLPPKLTLNFWCTLPPKLNFWCTPPPKLTLNYWCTLSPKLTLNFWCTLPPKLTLGELKLLVYIRGGSRILESRVSPSGGLGACPPENFWKWPFLWHILAGFQVLVQHEIPFICKTSVRKLWMLTRSRHHAQCTHALQHVHWWAVPFNCL